jgi:hypothetical protein
VALGVVAGAYQRATLNVLEAARQALFPVVSEEVGVNELGYF